MTRVENSVEKGKTAHYGQFLILSQNVQKSSAAETSESVCMWEMVKADVLTKTITIVPNTFSTISNIITRNTSINPFPHTANLQQICSKSAANLQQTTLKT